MGETLKLLFALFYVFCVMYALISDYTRLVIPNWLTLALAVGFVPYALLGGAPHIWTNVLSAAIVFIVFFVFFALNLIKAGDVKFIGALMLWAGLPQGVQLVTTFAILGGVFALGLLGLRYALRLYPAMGNTPGFGRLSQWARHNLCPYGLPIGVAALVVAPAIFGQGQ